MAWKPHDVRPVFDLQSDDNPLTFKTNTVRRPHLPPIDTEPPTMRITSLVLSTFLSLDLDNVSAFSPSRSFRPAAAINADAHITYNGITSTSALHAIGLGPGEDEQSSSVAIAEQPAVAEVEIDHEQYRTSRLSKIDEQCDEWYGALLGTSDETTYLGDVSVEARKRILTLPELKKAVSSEVFFRFTRR